MEEIKEDYVSYELAKNLHKKYCPFVIEDGNYDMFPESSYSRPTITIIVKWLRIKYGILIFVNASLDSIKAAKPIYHVNCWKLNPKVFKSFYNFNSPEEAYESAIKYVLEKFVR